jgi:hypothetical protein
VSEPVGTQQRRKRDAAAHVAAQELQRLVGHHDVVGAGVRQQAQEPMLASVPSNPRAARRPRSR